MPLRYRSRPKSQVELNGYLRPLESFAQPEQVQPVVQPTVAPTVAPEVKLGVNEYPVEQWNLLWAHHLSGAPFVWHYQIEGSWGSRPFAFLQEAREFLRQGRALVYIFAIRRDGIATWKTVDIPEITLKPRDKKLVGLNIYTLEQPILSYGRALQNQGRGEWLWRVSFWDGTKHEGMEIELTEQEFNNIKEELPVLRTVRVVDWVTPKIWGNVNSILVTLMSDMPIFPELQEVCIRNPGGDREYVCREDLLERLKVLSKERIFQIVWAGKFKKEEEQPSRCSLPITCPHCGFVGKCNFQPRSEHKHKCVNCLRTFKADIKVGAVEESKVTMQPVWPPQPQKGKWEITGTDYKPVDKEAGERERYPTIEEISTEPCPRCGKKFAPIGLQLHMEFQHGVKRKAGEVPFVRAVHQDAQKPVAGEAQPGGAPEDLVFESQRDSLYGIRASRWIRRGQKEYLFILSEHHGRKEFGVEMYIKNYDAPEFKGTQYERPSESGGWECFAKTVQGAIDCLEQKYGVRVKISGMTQERLKQLQQEQVEEWVAPKPRGISFFDVMSDNTEKVLKGMLEDKILLCRRAKVGDYPKQEVSEYAMKLCFENFTIIADGLQLEIDNEDWDYALQQGRVKKELDVIIQRTYESVDYQCEKDWGVLPREPRKKDLSPGEKLGEQLFDVFKGAENERLNMLADEMVRKQQSMACKAAMKYFLSVYKNSMQKRVEQLK